MSEIGVLVMAYGTPASAAELGAYYTHIRRGRAPSAQELADLRRRYDAIGGLSPLLERTRAQVAALAAALGHGYLVELGMKHARPFVEGGVAALLSADVGRVIGLVLAPHYSTLSVGEYIERAEEALAGRVDGEWVVDWHGAIDDLLSERVSHALDRFAGAHRVMTVMTAHSLPARAADLDDPTYPAQLEETAATVAERAKLEHWRVAWQSPGRTPEPWLEPDLLDVIRELPAQGFDGVLVCPAGFVSDHLEVLYDIDVEAARVAGEVGVRLERTASFNDDPVFIDRLAAMVREVASSP